MRSPLTSSAAMTMSAAPVSNKIPGNRLTRLSLSAKNTTHNLALPDGGVNALSGLQMLVRVVVFYIITTSNCSPVIKRFDLNFNLLADKDFDFRQRV